MSTRPYLKPEQVITNGDMSADITSDVTILQQKSLVCYQLSWTGTSPVGTVSVQGSNDYSLNADGSVNDPGTWTTLTLNVNGTPSTTISISGNSGDELIDPIGPTGLYAIRLIYTFVSGTGTLQSFIAAKVT